MNSVIDLLYSSLQRENKVSYFNSSRTELMCRCPYCGDSVKSSASAHLYIKTEPPFAFYCQRCESSGILNKGLLDDLSVDDQDIEGEVRKEISDFKKKNLTTKFNFNKPKKLKIPKIQDDFKWKKEYLEERIGCEITKKDIKAFRLIPNFEDLLLLNNMTHLLRNEKFYNDVVLCDSKGVGWLSRDNSHAIFRLKDSVHRYKIIKLSDSLTCSKVFSVQNEIDLLSLDFTVVMTEGTIDLLSVFKNLYKGEMDKNTLFVASGGKGFNFFPSLLQKEYGLLNLSLHIYSDNDVNIASYRNALQLFRYDHVNITYNTFKGEKDFGVPLCRIKVENHGIK